MCQHRAYICYYVSLKESEERESNELVRHKQQNWIYGSGEQSGNITQKSPALNTEYYNPISIAQDQSLNNMSSWKTCKQECRIRSKDIVSNNRVANFAFQSFNRSPSPPRSSCTQKEPFWEIPGPLMGLLPQDGQATKPDRKDTSKCHRWSGSQRTENRTGTTGINRQGPKPEPYLSVKLCWGAEKHPSVEDPSLAVRTGSRKRANLLGHEPETNQGHPAHSTLACLFPDQNTLCTSGTRVAENPQAWLTRGGDGSRSYAALDAVGHTCGGISVHGHAPFPP